MARSKRAHLLDSTITQVCADAVIRRSPVPDASRGFAQPDLRRVYLPEITSEYRYLVALHEIGHVKIGLCKDHLTSEAGAWSWAMDAYDRLGIKVPPHVWNKAIYALLTYGCVAFWDYGRKEDRLDPRENGLYWSVLFDLGKRAGVISAAQWGLWLWTSKEGLRLRNPDIKSEVHIALCKEIINRRSRPGVKERV